MSRYSRLFNVIMKKCFGGNVQEVKAGEFVLAVIRVLSTPAEDFAENEDQIDEIKAELESIRDFFAKQEIDLKSTEEKLAAFKRSGADEWEEKLVFKSVLDRCVKDNVAHGDNVSADKICRAIFKYDMSQINECIVYNEGKAPAKTDPLSDPIFEELVLKTWADISGAGEKKKEKKEETEPREPAVKPEELLSELSATVTHVREELEKNVFGQAKAIDSFISGYFEAELRAASMKERSKPRASFLFAGPPGVGKTFLAEQVARVLGLPFRRFDMSEYVDHESNIEFCGSDKVYKNGKEGNVTSFVDENPHCVLLFDEIEKAHISIIYLFLQMLDAGRLRDNFTDKEVSFKDAIIILTTNAGKELYEDDSVNLASVSRKAVLKALSSETNPVTGTTYFPPAICSRFASGNVIMFNRMDASQLLRVANGEMDKCAKEIGASTGLSIVSDDKVPYVMLYSEGANADARTVKSKSGALVYHEIYELLRLVRGKGEDEVAKLKKISFEAAVSDDREIAPYFKKSGVATVLVFGDKELYKKCAEKIKRHKVVYAASAEAAKRILGNKDISCILCDITYKKRTKGDLLNIEDVDSEGRDFMNYVTARNLAPVIVVFENEGDIGKEEAYSLAQSGARSVAYVNGSGDKSIDAFVSAEIEEQYRNSCLLDLAKANKIISYRTSQSLSEDGREATITFFGFRKEIAPDAGDNKKILDNVSKPDVRFDDVIGAKDAKEELNYFIEYLKDPKKFVRSGVKPPKGILLYGPPGTGKTLLAKAMAGESEVTFIRAEGNQFLKRYVGEGPEAIHDLFRTARKYAPSILFIDEIDVIGKERGMSEHEHHTDILTALLTEMDGFRVDSGKPVFVLAATNYSIKSGTNRSLDDALLRRFDRRIYVDLPGREERMQFIRKKVAKIKKHSLTQGMLDNIAMRSTGASLASLDSIFELALRNVIKSKSLTLTDEILEEAFEIFNNGEEVKWDERELLRTARHEAGHAIVHRHFGRKSTYMTIVSRGNHGGYNQAQIDEKGGYTKDELLSFVRASLGGRAAEIVYYGEKDGISTGASADLANASGIVKDMICTYGMYEEFGQCALSEIKAVGSEMMARIIAKINDILKEELAKAVDIVRNNKEIFDKLVDKLIEKSALKTEEIEEILKDVKN